MLFDKKINYLVLLIASLFAGMGEISIACDERHDNNSDCKSSEKISVSPDTDEELIRRFKIEIKNGLNEIDRVLSKDSCQNSKYIVYVNSDPICCKGFKQDCSLPIGSLSTQFTTYILLDILIKKYGKDKVTDIIKTPLGKINDLQRLCSSINCSWIKDVTIHQLLSHTSGLLGYAYFQHIISRAIISNFLFMKTNMFKVVAGLPYSQENKNLHSWHYSMFNYVIASMISEELSGKKFGDLVEDLAKAKGLKTLANLSDGFMMRAVDSTSLYIPSKISLLPTCIIQGGMSIVVGASDWEKFTRDFLDSEIFKICLDNAICDYDGMHCYGISCSKDDDSKVDSRFTFAKYCSLKGMLYCNKKKNLYVVCAVDSQYLWSNIFSVIDNAYDLVFNKNKRKNKRKK